MTAIQEAIDAAPVPAQPAALSWRAKMGYGIGSTAIGVINYGLSSLVLIYYNQVVGLPAETVGFAIMIALIVDAFWDPMLGHFSDQLRSSWGRRHPFMYFSALPCALAFFLLFSAPAGLSEAAAIAYLFTTLVALRIMLSFYEIPSASLAPELAPGYEQRTNLLSYRFFFAIVGLVTLGVLAFNVYLVPNERYDNGMLNREGYMLYGLTAAAVILPTILFSAAATHHLIPRLHRPPKRHVPVRQLLKEVGDTLWNRSLIALTIAGMFAAVARGLQDGLGVYFGVYFWQLKSAEISLLAVSLAVSTAIAVMLAPYASRALGKKGGVIVMTMAWLVIDMTPYVLRYFDLMPANGTDALRITLFSVWIFRGTAIAIAQILLTSMIADLTEDSQAKTGRRSEGLLLSADNILQKCVTGFGVFFSGLLLAAVQFPENASPETLDYSIVLHLAMAFVPTVTALTLAAMACTWFYRIDRAKHEENLRRISGAPLPD